MLPIKLPSATLPEPITVTDEQAKARTNIKDNAFYTEFRNGDIDTLVAGGRRLVIWASILAYIERQRLGIERDLAEKQAAAEAYARSLNGAHRTCGR